MVDTNVALAANGGDDCPQASQDCLISCVLRLQAIKENGRIVLDDFGWIFAEYRKYLRWDSQRPGYAFLLWVHDNLRNPERCDEVHITPHPENPGSFVEFPADPELADFDRDDRMFVAAALAHPERPPVLNAVDTDWWIFRDALARNGCRVEFLCENDVRVLAQEKHS